MYNTQQIAERIKDKIKENGYSVREVLSELHLGVNTLSQLANGQAISSLKLASIADYLDCSVDYLLGRAVPDCAAVKNNVRFAPFVFSYLKFFPKNGDFSHNFALAEFFSRKSGEVLKAFEQVCDDPASVLSDFRVKIFADSVVFGIECSPEGQIFESFKILSYLTSRCQGQLFRSSSVFSSGIIAFGSLSFSDSFIFGEGLDFALKSSFSYPRSVVDKSVLSGISADDIISLSKEGLIFRDFDGESCLSFFSDFPMEDLSVFFEKLSDGSLSASSQSHIDYAECELRRSLKIKDISDFADENGLLAANEAVSLEAETDDDEILHT